MVIGFKLSKLDRAEKQLQRLEELLKGITEQKPELKGRLKRVKLGDNSFLTLTLDGKLVPWEQVPIKDLEEKPGEFDKLVKKLKELQVTIALGIRDGYLLLGIGKDTSHLAKLGQGKSVAELPEFKPLAKHANKRLTSIHYVSKDMNTRLASNTRTIDDWLGAARTSLADAKLTAEQRKRIDKDLDGLGKDLKSLMPEPGAELSFTFLNGAGYESYSYDWGEHKGLDGSKPLTILNHAGGNPILVAAGRAKYSPEQYLMLVKWLKAGNGYIEEFVLPNLKGEEKEKFEKFSKAMQPLLKRLDEATGKMLLPALADGQVAFVLDAKLTSKQWIQQMPKSDKPLPMLEPAVVAGVSDAALLEKAIGEYRAIVNEFIAKLRELEPKTDIPDFKIPEPDIRKVAAGKIYAYALPKEWGLDKQIIPNAGLSDKVAVLTISQEHSERLLTSTPLKVSTGPLADLKRPMAAVVHFDWPALVDAATPWVEFAMNSWATAAGADEKSMDDARKQINTVLEVLKAFRGYSSCSYFEDKALITHSVTVFQDVAK